MSATITTLFIPNALPVVELVINTGTQFVTTYPSTFDAAIRSLTDLGIENVEYDEITDTRLLHAVE